MLKFLNIILISLLSVISFAQENITKQARNYINDNLKEMLIISIKDQELYHIFEGEIANTFIISSSKYGLGNKEGSNKTPLGLHKIKEKYGERTPVNGKMTGRVFNGEIASIYTDLTKSKTDDITSRILWLEGLEAGKNKGKGVDSYKRYIYIHGTSEEGWLGTPSSHGCIRMKNKDIIDLYKRIEVGTLVLIF